MGLDTTVPFTYREGLAGGLTKHALHSSAYRRLLHGVYLSACAHVDGYVEARAAVLASRTEAFVSFHTAARLWGGIVPATQMLHVSVPKGTGRSAPDGLTVHASVRTPVRFRGQPVTSPVDTFLDLAACLSLLDLVVLGDSLVRKGRTTPPALITGASGNGRGMALARRAAGLVRKGVDSPMETRSRMLRVLSGLPELETDLRFYDAEGNLRRRLDAGDRRTLTAVEYDGRHHIEREAQWEADLGRREEFEDEEWRIITLVSRDIYQTPGRTVERLARIFRARGIPVGRLTDEWRRYFPERG